MVKVKVWCRVDELEDPDRVKKALTSIFPTIRFRRTEGGFEGEGKQKDLMFLKELVWSKRVLDTVRSSLIRNLKNNRTELMLHKQAAFAGKLGVVESDEESPFGAIHVLFEGNVEEFIDWFSPKTKDGKPVTKNQRHSSYRS